MRILITAGPTREYLDDVRYLSNASSGRMGYALAEAAVAQGHQVVLISGPVGLMPPRGCQVHQVETTEELLTTCREHFDACDGVIATAAVCDYRPRERFQGKLAKTGVSLELELVETADVLADLGQTKGHRWIMGFALESAEFAHQNALRKLREKNCDIIVLNGPAAIGALTNEVELIAPSGASVKKFAGSKTDIATRLIEWIEASFTAR